MRTAIRSIAIGLLSALASSFSVSGQTPPCGVAVLRSSDGPKTDDRFIPASPEIVKADLLKALPALGYVVRKDQGLHVEALQDIQRLESIWETSADAGASRADAAIVSGPVSVEISEASHDGAQGSQLSIEFKTGFMGHKGSNAEPLSAETECLVILLGTNDPSKKPRGEPSEDSGPPRDLKLTRGTLMKVLLSAPVYSKEYKKGDIGRPIQFQVAEDVVVDGATVLRRGASVLGHLTDFKKAGGYGRHATLAFTFESATAVDGQQIPVTGEIEQFRGGRTEESLESTAQTEGAVGWLIKGADVFIRAGTGYDLAVSADTSIHVGVN